MLRKLKNAIIKLKNDAEICDIETKICDGKILVVSPHPDDESIGCGGVILKYRERVDVLLLTDGRLGNPEWTYEETAVNRRHEIEDAMAYAQINKLICLNYPDTGLKNHMKLKGVELAQYKYIFVPNRYENHPDHKAAYYIIKKNIKRQKSTPPPKYLSMRFGPLSDLQPAT